MGNENSSFSNSEDEERREWDDIQHQIDDLLRAEDVKPDDSDDEDEQLALATRLSLTEARETVEAEEKYRAEMESALSQSRIDFSARDEVQSAQQYRQPHPWPVLNAFMPKVNEVERLNAQVERKDMQIQALKDRENELLLRIQKLEKNAAEAQRNFDLEKFRISCKNDEKITLLTEKIDNLESQKSCSICLENYDEQRKMACFIGCGHCFCLTCARHLADSAETCATCRAPVCPSDIILVYS